MVDQTLSEFFPAPFREFVRKWIPLSVLVGVTVGLMAVTFQVLLQAFLFVFDPSRVPWYLVFLLPGLGGLLVSVLIPRLAPETAGQGMDEVIRSIHFAGGRIRAVVAPVKILVSTLTIGSGGSGGLEGPIEEIGASTASHVGGRLRLS